LAQTVLRNNTQPRVVQHYDPVRARLLLGSHNVLRFKLLDMPVAYQSFIRTRLRPDGTIIFADCSYTWLQYRLGDWYTFQVGELGGPTAEEHKSGSTRIEALQGADGSAHPEGWALGGMPSQFRPESEWGTVHLLRVEAEAFANALRRGGQAGAVGSCLELH
jgi:hypothetical protein